MGMSQLAPSIGGLLKNLGYATGQFGKNHVGDRNESLPAVNGFDEFFGNLYHLNAEEEPELPDYPKDPAYLAKFGPRWAEPFTKLRLQKIFNLYQDPYERADITSNTFWDWQLNHVGQVYGAMDDVMQFAMTFKEWPPRSTPPSFNPATIMEETLDQVRKAHGQK
jgi:hypothetical protein